MLIARLPTNPESKSSGVHLTPAVGSEVEKLLRRKDATVKSIGYRLDRFENTVQRERDKYARVVVDVEDAHYLTEDEAGLRNAKHRYREIGIEVKRNFSAQHVTLFRFMCRLWRQAGYPLEGVPIPEEKMTRLLKVSDRSIRAYKYDLEPYLVVERGGRSHPCRYRPAVSKADVAWLQASRPEAV